MSVEEDSISARGGLRCRTIPRAHTVRPYTFINPGEMASLFYKTACPLPLAML